MSCTVRIILCCRDDGRGLRATIDSILTTTRYESYELLVSATGNPGPDLSFLRADADRVRTIDSRELGLARSLGDAVRTTEAAYCVFLDAHCRVGQPDWLDRMSETFEAHPDAALVQPEVVVFPEDDEPRSPSERWRGAPTYGSLWTWSDDTSSFFADVTRFPGHETSEVMAGTGACTFVRSETFLRLGGFDPEIVGLRALTMDYCVRAWMLGAPTIVDPRIEIEHWRNGADDPACDLSDRIHAVLKTAYKYLSPRRRDIAERSFRAHDLHEEVERALARLQKGPWLRERVAHERARAHDDDWLFERFWAPEARYAKCE